VQVDNLEPRWNQALESTIWYKLLTMLFKFCHNSAVKFNLRLFYKLALMLAAWVTPPRALPVPRRGRLLGRAVQVDPIKPVMKAPGSLHLTLRRDRPVSNVAFNFDLRAYSWARWMRWASGA